MFMGSLGMFLSIFSYLLISMGVYFIAKLLKIPYTVLLVVTGVLLIPISNLSGWEFLSQFSLTSDMLFFIFLPVLIFESAYNIKLSALKENTIVITALSVVSFLVSTFFIGFAGTFAMRAIGFDIPFMLMLLFGTIISATDPVAVLALFKDFGAPKRLAMIFEGESLFNDATAFALFLILLDIIQNGYNGSETLLDAGLSFVVMLLGGVLFGIVFGGLFSKVIEKIKNNEKVELTLTMLVAHLAFIFTELISEQLFIGDFDVKISSIVATVTASMVIGNYGRYKVSPKIEEYMHKFWDYFAFVANSLVFLMMGVLFANLFGNFGNFTKPLLVSALIVTLARVFSIYPVLGLLGLVSKKHKMDRRWQHMLAFGDLKGALAVIMILLIPADMTIVGYSEIYTVKEFLTILTVGYIFFTLFVKATSLGYLMDRMKINALTPLEQIEYQESKALIYSKVLSEIKESYKAGYIPRDIYSELKLKYQKLYKCAYTSCGKLVERSSSNFEKLLRVYAIGIEKHALKNLLVLDEISEKVFKILLHKLDAQLRMLESGKTEVHKTMSFWPKTFGQRVWFYFVYGKSIRSNPEQMYMYYRALRIISKKVLDELKDISEQSHIKDFDRKDTYEYLISMYEDFFKQSSKKMNQIFKKDDNTSNNLDVKFAHKEIFDIEDKLIQGLLEREMITPKLQLILSKEIQEETC